MSQPSCRYLLTIETEADPQAPGRILGLVTRRNVLPSWFSARTLGDHLVRIVLEVRDVEPAEAGYLEQCVLKIPSVISAELREIAASGQVFA